MRRGLPRARNGTTLLSTPSVSAMSASCRSLGGRRSPAGRSGGGPTWSRRSCIRRSRSSSSSERSSVSIRSWKSVIRQPKFLIQQFREPRQPRPGTCLHRTERDTQMLRDLALRQAAPVGERNRLALALGQLLQGAVHAPGEPVLLRLLCRTGLVGRFVGHFGGSLDALAASVNSRVPRHRVQPRRARPALGTIGPGRPPDRRERLLNGVFGTAPIAQAPQREPEYGPRIPVVEVLEGPPVALGYPLYEL